MESEKKPRHVKGLRFWRRRKPASQSEPTSKDPIEAKEPPAEPEIDLRFALLEIEP